MRSAALRHAVAVPAAALTLYCPSLHAQDEVRALWVVRTTLTTTVVRDVAERYAIDGVHFDLFSYDSLTDSTRAPGYLFRVGRAAFNQ